MKNRTEKLAGKLKPSEILEKPWTHLTVDFITKLVVVAEKDAILVVCNRLSKITYFVAVTERTLVEGLARLFRDNVWKLHGLPESIVSDRGPQFTAELTKELNRMLGIKTKLSTVFYPQTDGQTKQMNQELEQYLRFFVDYRQKDWLEWLASAEFAVNNKIVIYKSTCPENYIPAVMPPLNPTSPPSTAATFLATRLMVVLQPSGYSVFHGGDTPIQLSFL